MRTELLFVSIILLFLPVAYGQSIDISGSILVDDNNEKVSLVDVYLIDANSYDILDSVHANDSGDYKFENVNTFGGTQDVFVNVVSESSFADINYNLFLQQSYQYQSVVYFNINSNLNINISINTNNNTETAFKIHNHIYKAFKYYRDVLGYTPSSEVNVYFPSIYDPGYSNEGNVIHLIQSTTDYKSTIHEYGHFIIDKTYIEDPTQRAGCTKVQTNPTTETGCKELAYEEGFADYHLSPPNNTDMGPSTVPVGLENTIFNTQHNTAFGHKFHGEISGILWDIADGPNSTDGSIGTDDDKIFNKDLMLWNVLYEYPQSEKPDDILEFYNRWVEKKDYVEYKNLQNELYDIYFNHFIPKGTTSEPISNDWAYFLHDPRRSGLTTLRGDLYHDQGTIFRESLGSFINNTLDKMAISDLDGNGKQDIVLTTGLNLTQGRVYSITYNRSFNNANLQIQTPLKLLRTTSRGFVGSPTLADVASSIGSSYNGKEIIFSADNIKNKSGEVL